MGRYRKDGQPTIHGNRYTAGSVARERVDKVIGFKPKLAVADALFADMEKRGLTPTQWLDMAVEKLLLEGDSVQNEAQREEIGVRSPLVQDAIRLAIATKQAALRAEKKKKPSLQDQALIEKWESEIEELEGYL